METHRGKRSEAYWPSIVMKKWLNIKQKAYEFSEDEVDSETESEDDADSVIDVRRRVSEDHTRRTQGILSEAERTPSKRSLRARRGKSETLRAQYINTKDVRVTIGTWNVAGRPPHEDLQIDEWLCMEEPADVYILGFQEVVPLNAGNVLGSETRRPIPKWESIIRTTLNKSSEFESNHKSYSAPASPVLRTCSAAADIIADVDDTWADSNDPESQKLHGVIEMGEKFQDWPEHPLDITSQILTSGFKLRRVLSSSARVGSDSNDNAQICGLKRVHHSTGNLGLMWMAQEEKHTVFDSLDDISDQCSDEEVEHENEVLEDGVKSHPRYVRIVSKQMVGIYISIWVRRRLRRHINNLKVSPVGTGLMGYMGNKGSVSVSMSLFQTRMCFVCSHLTSGHKDGYEQRRNSDVYQILRRTHFSSAFDTDQPLTIPSHDQVFWFGDLNYRINMLDSEVRKLVAEKQWDELLNNDQLSKELHSGVFDGWREGLINFPPTYKYGINSDVYVGENPKEGEKKRSPAWCDRILWLGKGIKHLSYKQAEIRISDHRPVSSTFLIAVEVFDTRKLRKALNFTSAAVHPEIFQKEDNEFDL